MVISSGERMVERGGIRGAEVQVGDERAQRLPAKAHQPSARSSAGLTTTSRSGTRKPSPVALTTDSLRHQ